jgi:hypothetical protein
MDNSLTARVNLPRRRSDVGLWSMGKQTHCRGAEAIQVYGSKVQHAKYDAAAKRAADWLIKASPKTTDEGVFQLLGLAWGRGEPGVKPYIELIKRGVRELRDEQRTEAGRTSRHLLATRTRRVGR